MEVERKNDQYRSYKTHSAQEITHLESELGIYKKEMSSITELYSTFIKTLKTQIDDGNNSLKELSEKFR